MRDREKKVETEWRRSGVSMGSGFGGGVGLGVY